MTDPSTNPRHPELDWLRVAAIILLQVFHTGMMFNGWAWHVKNDVLIPALTKPWELLHLLRMPLLMLVAGAGTAFALRKRSLGAFAKERTQRLLLPLVFGMLIVVPPQIYVERIVQGLCHPTVLDPLHLPAFQGSYLDFYPMVFRFQSYPHGALSWHHLWFVAYLFTYCLLTLPLFAWLKRPSGERFLAWAEAWLAKGWRIYLLLLPLAGVRILFRNFPETHDLVHDPKVLGYFGLLFLYGHLMGRCPRLLDRAMELRHWSIGLAAALYAVLAPDGELPFPFEHLAVYALTWLSLLAALGYARRHIRAHKPWLSYAQDIAYTYHILHQTLIVLIGYWLLRVPLGPWSRMFAVLLLSFGTTLFFCEVIRRTNGLRPFFGMKPKAVPPKGSAAPLEGGHTLGEPS